MIHEYPPHHRTSSMQVAVRTARPAPMNTSIASRARGLFIHEGRRGAEIGLSWPHSGHWMSPLNEGRPSSECEQWWQVRVGTEPESNARRRSTHVGGARCLTY